LLSLYYFIFVLFLILYLFLFIGLYLIYTYIFFFFFFNWRYNPWWVLACFTISFHNPLSLHFSLQFLTLILFISSSTCSSHLSLGLDEHGSHSVSFLTVLIMSILITCAAQRNLCDFINLPIVSFLIRIYNSSFVFILHVPSLPCIGPYIFLSTLLWNINRRFCSVTVAANV